MHTFFVNTSGKDFENYAGVLEVQCETRRLITFDCPLTKWTDENSGYKACIHEMEENIDNYKDINNDFNIIFYVDLISFKEYASIPLNAGNYIEARACITVMKSMLKRYIESTFVDELQDRGRIPGEVLIIFEQNPISEKKPDEKKGREFVRTFLGFPDKNGEKDDNLKAIAFSNDIIYEGQPSYKLFCQKIADLSRDFLLKDEKNSETSYAKYNFLLTYCIDFDIFLHEIQNPNNSSTFDNCVAQLLDRILKDDKADCVECVDFNTSRRADVINRQDRNKQEKTRRNLRLCFYILNCVKDGTIFDVKSYDEGNVSRTEREATKKVKEFQENINWEKVAESLNDKKRAFAANHKKIKDIESSFSKLKLAPELYLFNNEKFDLDEYGQILKKAPETLDTENPEDTEKNEKRKKKIKLGKEDEAVKKKPVFKKLLDDDKYAVFDYTGEKFKVGISKHTTPKQFINNADQLYKWHKNYLQNLKIHLSEILSNYAGRSAENEEALLAKRAVDVAEEEYEDINSKRSYPYAKDSKILESRKLKTVDDISEKSYKSTQLNYLEFCAGRPVSVSDIDEQYDWFKKRIAQITESLKKIIKICSVAMLILISLYVPFILLQFEAITKNLLTFWVAIASVFTPLLTLVAVSAIAFVIQRRKYLKTWKEFEQKSNEALRENERSAYMFDKLLAFYIPALRWVYEYKIDVDFYEECCKTAQAKLEHHKEKLKDRITTVGNIIEDLEMDRIDEENGKKTTSKPSTTEDIDYNSPFCTGAGGKNGKVYSIFDDAFLESLSKNFEQGGKS